MDYQVKHMGQHRNNARLWFETKALNDVGLARGMRYRAHWSDVYDCFVIMADPCGDRIVSGKTKNGGDIPIIDINDDKVLGVLAKEPAVKVVFDKKSAPACIRITKLSSAEMQAARKEGLIRSLAAKTVMVAALCFGGGMMDHAAHAGLGEAGLRSELVAAVEIDNDLLEHARDHNPVVTSTTRLIAAPMQELVQDDGAMSELPRVDILNCGIPCSGASISGRSKNGLVVAEEHPEVGHLVVPYIMLVNKFQPAVAVGECVVPYSKTVSAILMRSMFRDMGYDFHEVVLNSWDFGSIEARDRWFWVAVTHGIPMQLEGLAPKIVKRPKLMEFLDHDLDVGNYRPMQGLRDKEERDIEAGKGFRMQIVDGTATRIGTIGKDYNKNRSTEPKVSHPANADLLRLLTPNEHARIKGYPLSMIEGLSNTAAHQLLGQGVDARPVKALFKRVAQNLLAWDQTQHETRVAYSLGRATG